MKQVLQNLKDGSTEVTDVPCPRAGRGQLLIRTTRTLVSAGTERMLVDFGKAGLIDKARQQPDKVRMVIDKIRTDGLAPTLQAVRNKLDQPLPMGYCNVGEVVEVGAGVTGFEVGDRVASNGKHAEMVAVPVNLCAKVPSSVDDEEAAFTVLASIALQGIRLVQPTLGETVVVTGLGLIGLVTIQLLRAHGCRVLGLDFDSAKLALARGFGAEVVDLSAGQDPVAAAQAFSRGRGVDAVIITASTRSNEPVHQAALMSRKRGRIVLVGVTGLELSRADFFEKELTFQVSCSYGPGRYDPNYEDKGQDYPFGFVRWTEQRNFEAVLDMLGDRRLDVSPLVSHRFDIAQAEQAYAVVGGAEASLGIVLAYPEPTPLNVAQRRARVVDLPAAATTPKDAPGISVIGSGNYAGAVLIPAFQAAGARFQRIASSGGASSVHLGRKFGFAQATTDTEALLQDPTTDAVVIATRHDTHADFVVRALAAGKHVFVEKPLALTLDELGQVERAAQAAPHLRLMVGFNRRFAPQVQRISQLLASRPGPKSLVMTVNAGAIPANHWTQDPAVGGGRLLGEGCHFIDLLRFLVSAPVERFDVAGMDSATKDTVSVILRFADGSLGTIHYFANGSKAFPKERLEVFAGAAVLQLDNFRKLRGFGWSGFSSMNLWRQDKGQNACAKAFVESLRGGTASPVPLDELMEVSRLSVQIEEALR
ncbi:bi-domain-containing oxidoreductase [Piscinibacter terrae]|uniref:Dehydrogenase n=1 Tax=Piscinibacter terrae TaxID=2496871 RepID=A0A3N7HLX7_9BURK|nr:bi-domain-containing oxidoreductase [Albitalea terrae]RQP21611.1 dehydrogenase [Albitalea terrae]